MSDPIILTHGGVGCTAAWSDGCEAACAVAMEALLRGEALDAAVAAARVLEDDPRFNAGTGSALRLDGSCELDASVMTSEGEYGAVACITGVRHPTEVARMVMERTPHRILVGAGATHFARVCGVPIYSPITNDALNKLAKRLESFDKHPLAQLWKTEPFKGTIGAVTRTRSGRFAVACSTGGTSYMLPGRVGDSPIVGAGIFASRHGAVCCTGEGEFILTRMIAHRIIMGLEAGASLSELCYEEITNFPAGRYLGIIALSEFEDFTGATHEMPSAKRLLSEGSDLLSD